MLLVVGRIGRAHGVRGNVFVEPLTDEPDVRFADGSVLTTSSGTKLTVAFAKWHSGKFVVHFVGVDDRTLAEQLKTLQLSVEVDPDELPEDPDEFYDHQLVGLTVRLEDETEVGTVKEVIHLPAQDLLAVTTADGREVLIPFVSEIVPVVDVTGGFIAITPPPGLLNEEEAIEVRDEI
ncbi:MAG: ribosome maturation factor RimM [Actinobacteria bacterium]|nr:ribosome maturation factor RimM [Actinomycetota bacterium]